MARAANRRHIAADRRAIEYAKITADAAYFCHHYGRIDDASGDGSTGGVVPFYLWPMQAVTLWRFMTERLIIILKARQLGISWLCCIYALWLCLFTPGRTVLLFSKGKKESAELLRRIKVLYDRLPTWLKDAAPPVTIRNSTSLAWANESRIDCLPATENAGRSFTASLVIFDEAAFMQFADTVYVAMKPTIDAGGRLIVVSTANGLGGLFHRLWTMAEASANSYAAIFLPWWSRPGRDRQWYERMIAEATDARKVQQEYPATAQEAFITSGRARFDYTWIQAQSEQLRTGRTYAQLAAELAERPAKTADEKAHQAAQLQRISSATQIPGVSIYELPQPGRRYIIGADVAEGLEHGDYSAAVVIDAETWREVATIRGHYEPDTYADHLMLLGHIFNTADVVIERNNHGHAALAAAKKARYRKIAEGHDEQPGHLTNAKTKPQAIDALAVALRDQLCGISTAAALSEMQIYQTEPDGKTNAPEGYHDDLVMAWAIAILHAGRPVKNATATTAALWKRR